MTTLDDLIARLSAATGADRGLDALIAAHTGWDGWTIEEWEPFTRGEPGKDWAPEHPPVMDRCPAYTGSLDAAMALCSYGMHSIEFHLEPGGWVVSIDGFTATATTRELAFSAAALKARKARP